MMKTIHKLMGQLMLQLESADASYNFTTLEKKKDVYRGVFYSGQRVIVSSLSAEDPMMTLYVWNAATAETDECPIAVFSILPSSLIAEAKEPLYRVNISLYPQGMREHTEIIKEIFERITAMMNWYELSIPTEAFLS
ncbi:MAG: hypothetical protein V4478_00410 [Patescibacteria group bacterium]